MQRTCTPKDISIVQRCPTTASDLFTVNRPHIPLLRSLLLNFLCLWTLCVRCPLCMVWRGCVAIFRLFAYEWTNTAFHFGCIFCFRFCCVRGGGARKPRCSTDVPSWPMSRRLQKNSNDWDRHTFLRGLYPFAAKSNKILIISVFLWCRVARGHLRQLLMLLFNYLFWLSTLLLVSRANIYVYTRRFSNTSVSNKVKVQGKYLYINKQNLWQPL